MKSWRVFKDKAQMSLAEIESPRPGPNDLLIDVAACGLNFADLLLVQGQYQEMPPYPFTPGLEMAGRVVAVGADVSGFATGDRVAAFAGQGGLAQQAAVSSTSAIKIPDEMPFDVAAAFQVAYGTSHVALSHRANLRADETLVVFGAAGGVGLTAVELGALMGAKVIAVARGDKKLGIARQAGAHHLIDSEEGDLKGALRKLGGADVVYDPVGGNLFDAALRATNPEGRILSIGFASGNVPQVPANILLVKNLSVIGFYWGGYAKFRPEILHQSMETLLNWYEQGKLQPHIGHRVALEEADQGMELLASRRATGKVVIVMP